MGLIGGKLGRSLLKRISPNGEGGLSQGTPRVYLGKSKLEVLFGRDIWNAFRGKTVVDFGCGTGHEAVELAEHGAEHVIGLDLSKRWLETATKRANEHDVADRCTFSRTWPGAGRRADAILSLDSFEHFDDPAAILTLMRDILKPDGRIIAAFGPTWYHPYGGHLYSVFPWAHFVFTERALLEWRSTLPGKGTASSFRETGLNRMTVGRFERLVAESPFRFESFEAVPIRRLRWCANRPLREVTTAIVRCELVPRAA